MSQIDHVVVAVHDLDRASRAYRALGFSLTPRAQHPWGTANRLVQFAGMNFIELLEIDRPELILTHDLGIDPPVFSFGAHNRDFLDAGEGLSMFVLAGRDARADVDRFRASGIDTFAPFDFERTATLPGGERVKVAFSLAFATHPEIPQAAFFTCHNKYPKNFWKPEYQAHENGALGISEVVLVAEEPERYASFLEAFTGGPVAVMHNRVIASCAGHRLVVLAPAGLQARFGPPAPDLSDGPRFAALVIETASREGKIIPARSACGVLLEFRARRK